MSAYEEILQLTGFWDALQCLFSDCVIENLLLSSSVLWQILDESI